VYFRVVPECLKLAGSRLIFDGRNSSR